MKNVVVERSNESVEGMMVVVGRSHDNNDDRDGSGERKAKV